MTFRNVLALATALLTGTSWALEGATATEPVFLSAYSLTSANDFPSRDPRDWRLLGSNDGGRTWMVLDQRTGEAFEHRFEQRTFSVSNRIAALLFRLEIDAVRNPKEGKGVQLAELELRGGPDGAPESDVTPFYNDSVTAQGELTPAEIVRNLFDGEPETKWFDPTENHRDNCSSWIQWPAISGSLRVISSASQLRQLSTAQAKSHLPVRLEAISLSTDLTNGIMHLCDAGGYLAIRVDPLAAALRPGQPFLLEGHTDFAPDFPKIIEARIQAVGDVPTRFETIQIGQIVTNSATFFPAETQGTLRRVTENDGTWILELIDGSKRMRAQILQANRDKPAWLLGTRVRVQGFCEAMFDTSGSRIAGTMWIPGLEAVTLVDPTEEDWQAHPVRSLVQTFSSDAGTQVGQWLRVQGRVERCDGQSMVVVGEHSLITGLISNDGVHWTEVGSAAIRLGHSVFAGLVITAHDNQLLGSATFDSVSPNISP